MNNKTYKRTVIFLSDQRYFSELPQLSVFFFQEIFWLVEFQYLTMIQYLYSIIVRDHAKSMCKGDHHAILEHIANYSLNQFICLLVNLTSCFVKDSNFSFLH